MPSTVLSGLTTPSTEPVKQSFQDRSPLILNALRKSEDLEVLFLSVF